MWEYPYVVCICPVALVGELNLKVSSDCIFPQGVLATTTLVGGLKLERLKPKPDANLGFSYAHWSSLPCWRWSWRLWGWKRSPEGAGFLLVTMAVSTLV